jgi:hypothetical protein
MQGLEFISPTKQYVAKVTLDQIKYNLKGKGVGLDHRELFDKAIAEENIGFMGREEKIWNQIEVLASEKKAKSYDQAIDLLVDLRDLAQREKSTDFSAKFDALKQRHSSKSSFIQRLKNVSV